jgi:hypothetical protein
MCSRRNLKIAFKFLFLLQFAEFLALIIIGSIFVGDVDLQRGYGGGIVDHGGGLVRIDSSVCFVVFGVMPSCVASMLSFLLSPFNTPSNSPMFSLLPSTAVSGQRNSSFTIHCI